MSQRVRETIAYTQRRHRERIEGDYPDLSEPELAAAWRECQLCWLRTIPGYREQIRARVSEAARRAEANARRIERTQQRLDVDLLGREVEGCG